MKTTLVLKNIQVSFPAFFEPREFEGRYTYGADLLLDPIKHAAEIDEINKIIDHLKITKKYASLSPAKKLTFHTALRPGSHRVEKADPGKYPMYEGKMYLSCSSLAKDANKNPLPRPMVVDKYKNEVLDANKDEIYGGCIGNAIVNFFYWDNTSKAGISCSIQVFQKTADGEKFGGGFTKNQALDLLDDFSGASNEISLDEEL